MVLDLDHAMWWCYRLQGREWSLDWFEWARVINTVHVWVSSTRMEHTEKMLVIRSQRWLLVWKIVSSWPQGRNCTALQTLPCKGEARGPRGPKQAARKYSLHCKTLLYFRCLWLCTVWRICRHRSFGPGPFCPQCSWFLGSVFKSFSYSMLFTLHIQWIDIYVR